MIRLPHHFILTVALCCFAGSCSQAEPRKGTPGPSSVWVAEKDGHHIYLAGTIHLLREEDYPLPAVFDQAYADSSKVVFELPPGSDNDGAIALRMRQMGTYPGDDELSQHISETTMKKVQAWGAKNGFTASSLAKLRPWFLALTIAAIGYQQLGAAPDHGVDQHFELRAKEDGKPSEGLESVEFQLSIFSNLSDQLQEELLLQTFAETETLAKDFQELTAGWRSGDATKLHELLFRDADKYPQLMEDFLLKRNKSWIPPLLSYLKKGERVMVLVGAGHLGGKGGVLELLKEKGCTVRQLGR